MTSAAQIAAPPGEMQLNCKLHFNSDWQGYRDAFDGQWTGELVAEPGKCDGLPYHGALYIGPYSVLIFSQ